MSILLVVPEISKSQLHSTLGEVKIMFPCADRDSVSGLSDRSFSTMYNNDDFKFEVEKALFWCQEVALKYPLRKTINYSESSYYVKHVVERWLRDNDVLGDRDTNGYVGNMAVVCAYTMSGINQKARWINGRLYGNPYSNISKKAFKGYY